MQLGAYNDFQASLNFVSINFNNMDKKKPSTQKQGNSL